MLTPLHAVIVIRRVVDAIPFVESGTIDPRAGTATAAYFMCMATGPVRAMLDVLCIPYIAHRMEKRQQVQQAVGEARKANSTDKADGRSTE